MGNRGIAENTTQAGGGLSGNALKIIAIIAMTIDHLTWLLLPGFRTDPLTILLHVIGRLTAPIMMYFIAEGYFHTRALKKYVGRMLAFAVVSHFAYQLLFGDTFNFLPGIPQTSVLWPFAMGLLALWLDQCENPKLKRWHRFILIWICLILAFPADWSMPAAVTILYMGRNRGNFRKQMTYLVIWIATYSAVYFFFIDRVYGILQMTVVFAIPLLSLYNNTRGKWKGMKYFFYVYYPAHMAILGLIRIYVLRH
ncbi:MAG: conjugal transfer protein TraX [Lachnospiraceae bacterium]|nr:conjugal transfer protein TraX [Lachnospiraceae bacterium]